MSRSVTAHVSINGDQGVDYKIQIFDASPLSPESTAKLLAEGTVTQSMTLDVVMGLQQHLLIKCLLRV